MIKIILPAAVAITGLLLAITSAVHAKPEYTKTEKKACTACHTKMGSKDLSAAGKEWQQKKKSK